MLEIVLLIGVALVTGCQSLSTIDALEVPTEYLVTESEIHELAIPGSADFRPLEVTDDMRQFVQGDIRKFKSPYHRARAIVNKLAIQGYYVDAYESGLTQTAAETFESKRGNCLSYTHMYIALARLAGLNARYELVNIPPTFEVTQGVLEHQVHIRVHIPLRDRLRREQYINIDFNQENNQFEGRVVSDDWAKALHYSNDAVELWHQGSTLRAFASVSEAIRLTPRNADLWGNLATFYKRVGDVEEAKQISRYALSLNSRQLVAMSLLASSPNEPNAIQYRQKLSQHRERNPHYQFALAQRAYYRGSLDGALDHVDRAIKLNRRDASFLKFKADVLVDLNEIDEALEVYRVAHSLSKDEENQMKIKLVIDELEEINSTNS